MVFIKADGIWYIESLTLVVTTEKTIRDISVQIDVSLTLQPQKAQSRIEGSSRQCEQLYPPPS